MPSLRPSLRPLRFSPWKSPSRFYSSPKEPPRSRFRRLNDRLPSFLRSYTTPLLGAPGTHITSFLILHELTAIVPLFGLVAAFHYGNWFPDLTSSAAFEEGTRRFGRWLRKKGWVEDDAEMDMELLAKERKEGSVDYKDLTPPKDGERKGMRLVWEFATAYAVTKALLPLRLAASVWATPWFARAILGPVGGRLRALFGRK
ncbi:hypothetical protein P170DRAFT_433792 [Aspergillus steynii IBT 23096]|uniref:Uncharacterized protein n=1 Tax=Aspergillus steynii IBT 23096 TaxID=1392250 RepID=A0A2I2GG86_9EURO|nr:uncharacterized protein P170DRAFT_433792 [Aspergillus steynii IBT 23096]PLB51895.1 hypothetical protein P170DRAFT_433792 [Aspergillus steynii IBT 23096]